MPLFEFTGDDSRYSQTSSTTFNFLSLTSVSPTSYTYLTTENRYVTLTGYDFTIDFTGRVIGGTVTAVAISLDGASVTNYGLTISGLSMDAVVFAGAGSDGTSAAIFDDMFAGPTTVTSVSSNSSSWGLDGTYASAGFSRGGENSFTGDWDGYYSLGVISTYGTAIFRGGDSTSFGSANEVFGDSIWTYDDAVVIGGDDRIIFRDHIDPATGLLGHVVGDVGPFGQVVGDVGYISNQSSVVGGDDFLDARSISDSNRTLYLFGDAKTIYGTSSLVGGDDRIFGSATVGSLLVGDVGTVFGTPNIIGGDDTLYGGSGDDIIAGDVGPGTTIGYVGGDDTLYGGGGDDTLYGQNGRDRIYVGAGASTAYGGDGDDYVRVNRAGDHALYGGDGIDKVSFSQSGGGVNVNLETGATSRGFAAGVTISGFENVSGSSTGWDTIYGSEGANEINTYGGNDKVYGGGGGDKIVLGRGNDYVRAGEGANTYYGESGTDTISYYDSDDGVTVDMLYKTASGGYANGDIVGGFERLSGSGAGDDDIKGTNGANIIKTYGGEDRINGRNGNDKLYGGAQDDRINGGKGNDSLYGGDGQDRLDGDLGNDKLWGNASADVFVFERGADQDIIKDFQNNIDTIEIGGYGSGYNAMSRASQVGSDVVFNFGNGDTLTVENTTIGFLVNDLVVV